MTQEKLSNELSQRLLHTDEAELLEVIVEFDPPQAVEPSAQTQSRGERIAIMKDTFTHQSATVENEIQNAGGEVTGRAWINQTIKARVPAHSIKQISKNEKVKAVDIPHALITDD